MNATTRITRRLAMWAAVAAIGVALTATSLFGGPGAARAQSPSCTTASAQGPADANGFAIVDVGAGIGSFACLGLANGTMVGPISVNGVTANNCYTVAGLGGPVVRVFTANPALGLNCPVVTGLSVGVTLQVGTATPTAATGSTATATATATVAVTATATGTSVTATPTATRTATPTPFVPTATPFAPTATQFVPTPAGTAAASPVTSATPRPPATGDGDSTSSGTGAWMLVFGLVLVVAGAGGATTVAIRERRR